MTMFLQKRHHRGDNYPLSLDDLLDEAKMLDITSKHKAWLGSEVILHSGHTLVMVFYSHVMVPWLGSEVILHSGHTLVMVFYSHVMVPWYRQYFTSKLPFWLDSFCGLQ